MFRTCFGRLLAEAYGLRLDAPQFLRGTWLRPRVSLAGERWLGKSLTIDGDVPRIRELNATLSLRGKDCHVKGRFVIAGEFRIASLYFARRAEMQNEWFTFPQLRPFGKRWSHVVLTTAILNPKSTTPGHFILSPSPEKIATYIGGKSSETLILIPPAFTNSSYIYEATGYRTYYATAHDVLSLSQHAEVLLTTDYSIGWWAGFLSRASYITHLSYTSGNKG